ncbi:DUF805 domain-containing protein [Pediococcus siamensis]|uniref:DUF805 domain-containing protein n=1 Tax=Pediococcus siamensis TaxID=381829 RepID=UPI0039A0828E
MITSYQKYWSNITNFSGTANRPDYWWPVIINWLLGGIIVTFLQAVMGHPITDIYTWQDLGVNSIRNIVLFFVWIANLSVSVRRLHDTNRSGWWVLIQLIPLIGGIWFFILMLLPSRPSRWGENY